MKNVFVCLIAAFAALAANGLFFVPCVFAMPVGTLLYRSSLDGEFYGYNTGDLLEEAEFLENGHLAKFLKINCGHVGIYAGQNEDGEDMVLEAIDNGVQLTPAKFFVNTKNGEKFIGARIPKELDQDVYKSKIKNLTKYLAEQNLEYDFDFRQQKGLASGQWICAGLTEKIYESLGFGKEFKNLSDLQYDPAKYFINITPDGYDDTSIQNSATGDVFSAKVEYSKIARRPWEVGLDYWLGKTDNGNRYFFLPYTQYLQPTLEDVPVDIQLESSFDDSRVRGVKPMIKIVALAVDNASLNIPSRTGAAIAQTAAALAAAGKNAISSLAHGAKDTALAAAASASGTWQKFLQVFSAFGQNAAGSSAVIVKGDGSSGIPPAVMAQDSPLLPAVLAAEEPLTSLSSPETGDALKIGTGEEKDAPESVQGESPAPKVPKKEESPHGEYEKKSSPPADLLPPEEPEIILPPRHSSGTAPVQSPETKITPSWPITFFPPGNYSAVPPSADPSLALDSSAPSSSAAVFPPAASSTPATSTEVSAVSSSTIATSTIATSTSATSTVATSTEIITTSTASATISVWPHLLISEFSTRGPGGAYDEFLEIYNPSGSEVDLSGWRFQSSAAGGESWVNRSGADGLPPAAILSHGYFLLAAKDYGNAAAPDYRHAANWGLADNGGWLRLADASGAVIDKIAYGSAAIPDSVLSMIDFSAGQSAERKAKASSTSESMLGSDAWQGNGHDTDSGDDFAVRAAPEPQNSAALAEPCDPPAATSTATDDPPEDGAASGTPPLVEDIDIEFAPPDSPVGLQRYYSYNIPFTVAQSFVPRQNNISAISLFGKRHGSFKLRLCEGDLDLSYIENNWDCASFGQKLLAELELPANTFPGCTGYPMSPNPCYEDNIIFTKIDFPSPVAVETGKEYFFTVSGPGGITLVGKRDGYYLNIDYLNGHFYAPQQNGDFLFRTHYIH